MNEADKISEKFRARGAPILMSAWIDQLFFYYLDTTPMSIEVWTGDFESLQTSRTYP
jgi:spore germination protein YaaH